MHARVTCGLSISATGLKWYGEVNVVKRACGVAPEESIPVLRDLLPAAMVSCWCWFARLPGHLA